MNLGKNEGIGDTLSKERSLYGTYNNYDKQYAEYIRWRRLQYSY